MRYNVYRIRLVAALLAALLPAACNAESSNGGGDYRLGDGGAGIGGSDGDGDGAGGTSAGGKGGSSSNSGAGGGSSGSGGGIDPEEVCAGKKVDPEPVEITVETLVPYEVVKPSPIAIYLMLDKTGSMDQENPTKWSTAVNAINTFVTDPDSQFIDVALQYFSGDGGWGSGGTTCDGVVYSQPAVPMGPLPDNAANITASLAATSPGGNTPLEGALRGLALFCIQFEAQNPDKPCVGVLISDGEPTSCNQDDNALVAISQDAYDQNNIKTFAVGMQGADFGLLNQIALWAGTDCTPNDPATYACDVTPGSGMTLLQAFEAIREFVTVMEERTEYRTEVETKISQCDWGIPDPPEGETFDPGMVNVVFSQPGEDDMTIPHVGDKSECADVFDGWYYDDNDDPTKLVACDQTCTFITSVVGATIDIQFGCKTKEAVVE